MICSTCNHDPCTCATTPAMLTTCKHGYAVGGCPTCHAERRSAVQATEAAPTMPKRCPHGQEGWCVRCSWCV